MTPGQKRTIKRLGIAAVGFAALVAWLLYTEARGLAEGAAAEATISELVWLAWASQPWVIWLVSVVLVGIAAFLAGHFLAQRATVYDGIRRGPSVSLTVDTSQFERGMERAAESVDALGASMLSFTKGRAERQSRAEHAEHIRADASKGGK